MALRQRICANFGRNHAGPAERHAFLPRQVIGRPGLADRRLRSQPRWPGTEGRCAIARRSYENESAVELGGSGQARRGEGALICMCPSLTPAPVLRTRHWREAGICATARRAVVASWATTAMLLTGCDGTKSVLGAASAETRRIGSLWWL